MNCNLPAQNPQNFRFVGNLLRGKAAVTLEDLPSAIRREIGHRAARVEERMTREGGRVGLADHLAERIDRAGTARRGWK